jgi:hypothetical protein
MKPNNSQHYINEFCSKVDGKSKHEFLMMKNGTLVRIKLTFKVDTSFDENLLKVKVSYKQCSTSRLFSRMSLRQQNTNPLFSELEKMKTQICNLLKEIENV